MVAQNENTSEQGSLQRWFRSLRFSLDRITMGMNVCGTLLILAVMVLVNADVIGRGVFDQPISGVPEMVSMSIVAIVFLQVAQTFKMGKLTRSEALLGILGRRLPRIKAAVELAFCCGAIAVMLQLLSASWPLFVKSWQRNTFEGTIGDFTAPVWPVKLIILVGSVALIIQMCLMAMDSFGQCLKKPAREVSSNHE